MDRHDVRRWVDAYERAWRAAGTAGLAGLFTQDATYRASPWAPPVEGLEAISEFWEAEREGPDEDFTMASEVVAVDGDTAVVARTGGVRRPGAGALARPVGAAVRRGRALPCLRGVAVRPGAARRALTTDREATSDALLDQAGVDVVQEPADGDRVGDQWVAAHLADVVAERGLLVLDDAEVLPGGVLAG